MSCKFKFGDRVKVGKHLGEIVSVRKNLNSNYLCKVKFDNKFLIPSEMEYKEEELQFEDGRTVGCPICQTPWHEVKFGQHVWKDCLKCNKKEEDIIEIQKNKINTDFNGNTRPPGFYDNKSIIDEFQKMLDDDDDVF